MVILEETPDPPIAPHLEPHPVVDDGSGTPEDIQARRIAELEQELQTKHEYLQNVLEEMESSSEELKSSNEEMQSVNEELQSTNEELETSKEELQSVNEELATVNTELQNKVADLSQANNDMNNLLAGTGVGTVFVDHNLRILRFTPSATELINLIPSDVGRPVSHIVANLVGYNRLVEELEVVLRDLVPREAEVKTHAGLWYLMRIRPYRTLENVIEGAVITFVEITELKEARESALEAKVMQHIAESIVDTVREPLLVLDGGMRIVSANHAFFDIFQEKPTDAIGCSLFDLGSGQWDIPDLRKQLMEILPKQTAFNDFIVTHEFDRIGKRKMRLNARLIQNDEEQPELILLAIEDITE